jgi:hypothetical protein
MLAVGRLKLERGAVLGVRVSGEGKTEVVGLRGEFGIFSWDGMVTTGVSLVVVVTGNLEHLGRSAMFCGVLVCVSIFEEEEESEEA